MSPSAIIIVPARYASTRFPGKPLALLGGKPIIAHVIDRARLTGLRIVVATDDERILQAVRAYGAEAVMTSPDHPSGTDRVIEAYRKVGQGEQIVINLQGDEPFVLPEQIHSLVSAFDPIGDTAIATLAETFPQETSNQELCNPNLVKVVRAPQGQAYYFSRSPIPYLRGVETGWCAQHQYYRHIGLYAFRADVLEQIASLPPSTLERCESLEQLRWLEAGLTIRVMDTSTSTIGIDTPEDLQRAAAFLSSHSQNLCGDR